MVAELSEEQKPEPAKTVGKAEFKAVEKTVKLENIPNLSGKPEKKGPFGRAKPKPKEEEQAKPKIPQVSPQDLRPTIQMAAAKWNQFLEAPVGDEKARYRWNEQDTDNIINAMAALDEKYHFMGNWLQYMPEVFALIVVAGIVGKLVMGARWKNAQNMTKAAAPQETVKPAAPPTIMERIQNVLKPPEKAPGAGETIPPDLAREATEYLKNANPK